MATRILAYFGATVLKVEGPDNPDGWRGQLEPSDWAMCSGGAGVARPFDRNSWFNTQNHDKLSVVIDLRSAAGRNLGRRLALCCDVVAANFRAGVLARLGLDRESLAAEKTELVVIEMPAFGAGGPSEAHAALGPTMEASIGAEHMIGHEGGPPIGSGTAYLDPIGGLFGAAAVLTALVGRAEGLGGAGIEVAQREAALHYFGEWMLEADAKGIDRLRLGNVRPGRVPHGAFRCAGDDEWIAISVHDDGEWSSLAAVVGGAELAGDPRFATVDRRSRDRHELEHLISAWTSKKDKAVLARALQEAGVRAAPVCNAVDLAADEELRQLGFFTVLDHAEVGAGEYPGLPFHLPATPGAMRTAAPGFGAHTRQVLAEWLGLSGEEIDALYTNGVCADAPSR
jgi:crotonobetainyl-CoA:carnitine CoA-transferase CaiB-like acyl-CoA transferase